MIGQLVRSDGKEIPLQGPGTIVIRKAVDESDQGFLDDILSMRSIGQASPDKSEQPPFESIDELLPRIDVPAADAVHQNLF